MRQPALDDKINTKMNLVKGLLKFATIFYALAIAKIAIDDRLVVQILRS